MPVVLVLAVLSRGAVGEVGAAVLSSAIEREMKVSWEYERR